MDLYTGTTACVRTTHGPTLSFSTSSGVLQGDTLAPYLFVLLLDIVLRRALSDEDAYLLRRRRSKRVFEIPLPALDFADDIALVCKDPRSANQQLQRIELEASRVGLLINANKTEVLHVGFSNPEPVCLRNGDVIPTTDEFRYLGSLVFDPESIFRDRRASAWRAAISLKAIFFSSASDDTKIRLFRSTVEPILKYGAESIPMTQTRERNMDASHRALLRFSLGIQWPNTLSCEDLTRRTGHIVPSFSKTLRLSRLKLLGRVLHGSPNTPLALTLRHAPTELRRRGQANRVTLRNTFLADIRELRLNGFTDVTEMSPAEFSHLCRGL